MSRNVTPRADWSSILVEDEESDQPIAPVVVSALLFELSVYYQKRIFL